MLQNSHEFTPPDDGSGDIVVTAHNQISDSSKYVFAGGRSYLNPHYVDPAPWLNLTNFVGIQVAGFAAAGGVAALPALSESMAVSRTFGVASSRFGNNFYRGGAGQGSWNYGSVRLGWSFNRGTGNVYFQPRIGDFHVPTPIFTPAPW